MSLSALRKPAQEMSSTGLRGPESDQFRGEVKSSEVFWGAVALEMRIVGVQAGVRSIAIVVAAEFFDLGVRFDFFAMSILGLLS